LGGLDEVKTRRELIDPALKKVGWDITNPTRVCLEISINGSDVEVWRRLERSQQHESERQAEHLFQTLLQRAFSRGVELNA
jgi:predicted type IV restriction endonuclease